MATGGWPQGVGGLDSVENILWLNAELGAQLGLQEALLAQVIYACYVCAGGPPGTGDICMLCMCRRPSWHR